MGNTSFAQQRVGGEPRNALGKRQGGFKAT